MNLQILQQGDQNKTEYGEGNENDSSIKFETNIIKLFLCDYSDACILITGDIKAPGWNENTNVAFKNCAPFAGRYKWWTHYTAEYLDIIMPTTI